MIIKRISVKLLLKEKLKFVDVCGIRLNNDLLADLHIAKLASHKWVVCTDSTMMNTAVTYYWKGEPMDVATACSKYSFRYDWTGIVIDDEFFDL